jgi:hypothetical protein
VSLSRCRRGYHTLVGRPYLVAALSSYRAAGRFGVTRGRRACTRCASRIIGCASVLVRCQHTNRVGMAKGVGYPTIQRGFGTALEPHNRKNGAALRGERLPASACERRRQTAKALNLGRFLRAGYHGRWWTAAELRMLGKVPDAVVASRTGRPVNGVRVKRTKLGIPSARDRRRRECRG